jgi:hypothetical protein
MNKQNIPARGEMIDLSEITTDGETQARLKINQETVNHYAGLLSDGVEFDAVVVFSDGKKKYLADGFHRYFAHRQNGLLQIEAVTIKGSLRDAQWFAFGSNVHGLPFTKEERHANIRRCLLDAEWGKLSDRELAAHLNTSRSQVLRVRQAMEGEGKLEKTKMVRVSDDKGRKFEKVKDDSKKPEVEPTPEPTPNLVEEMGAVKTIPIDEKELELQQAADTINQLEEENKRLRDAIALGQWDASEIEKIDVQETLAELRQQVKLLEMETKTLRNSRDMYQMRNAELVAMVKSLQAKVKKLSA